MIISGKEIKKRLGNDVTIEPFHDSQLNPNSYNLRLHNELLVYTEPVIDMKRENPMRTITIPEEGLLLEPGKLYLGRTVEFTKTDSLVPMLEGRSSLARLGLFIEVSASLGNVGTAGYWTLEIMCIQPIRIYSNVEICQIFYHTILGDFDRYKSDKYQNNRGVQPSLFYKEFKKDDTEK